MNTFKMAKVFCNCAKVAKFHQIWSHWTQREKESAESAWQQMLPLSLMKKIRRSSLISQLEDHHRHCHLREKM